MPDMEARVTALEAAHVNASAERAALRAAIDENTALTRGLLTSTQGIVEFQQSLEGLYRLLNWVGRALRPIGWIAVAVAAIAGAWAALKTGTNITPK